MEIISSKHLSHISKPEKINFYDKGQYLMLFNEDKIFMHKTRLLKYNSNKLTQKQQQIIIQMGKRDSKKYAKIPVFVKRSFIHKILLENRTIKQASKQYKINYSTAKTILRIYRAKSNLLLETDIMKVGRVEEITLADKRPQKRCNFREIIYTCNSERNGEEISNSPKMSDIGWDFSKIYENSNSGSDQTIEVISGTRNFKI